MNEAQYRWVQVDSNGIPTAIIQADEQAEGWFAFPDACASFDDLFRLGWVVAAGGWVQLGPRPSHNHLPDPDRMCWADLRSTAELAAGLQDAQARAVQQVNRAAGSVRLRYITDAPGQAAVYLLKEQQARAWAAAGFVGDAPPFIAAEAAAIGITPQSLAQEVLEAVDRYAQVVGPSIEACRRKWCVAIGQCSDEPAVASACQLGLTELASI